MNQSKTEERLPGKEIKEMRPLNGKQDPVLDLLLQWTLLGRLNGRNGTD